MSLDTDLATLRELASGPTLERVEAELVRLREERETALEGMAAAWAETNKAERELARLREGLRPEIAFALPEHGGVCDGTDAKPSAKDPRGSFANPCIRCRVLLALDRALLADTPEDGAM